MDPAATVSTVSNDCDICSALTSSPCLNLATELLWRILFGSLAVFLVDLDGLSRWLLSRRCLLSWPSHKMPGGEYWPVWG